MSQFLGFYKRKFYWTLGIGIGAIIVFVGLLYQLKLEEARNQEFEFYQTFLDEKVSVLIKQKQHATQALAIALTTPPNFKKALISGSDTIQDELKKFSTNLRELTEYKEIWIQLVGKDGVSLARSWTDKKGDDLSKVRKDIRSMIKEPRLINSFSVGKFALTFKTIVPVFDDNEQFVGMVDVISQVNSIDQTLAHSSGVRSVVLVDKIYRKQLTNATTGLFIDDYYVANSDAKEADVALIKKYGVDEFLNINKYLRVDNMLVVSRNIMDINGKHMANWIMFKPIETFEFVHLKNTQKQITMIAVFVAILLLALALMLYFKIRADIEKRFFYEIFNTSTEIVYVTDRQSILFANKQFYKTLTNGETLESFLQNYQCVSDLFEEGDDFLQSYVNNLYWYDYILENDHKAHYAKLTINGQTRIFAVRGTEIVSVLGKPYTSVLMRDITEEEHYKNELENLIIHDELTGVHNRHYFNQVLDHEVKRQNRYQTSFLMAAIDIDHFKQVNDSYGHDVGDAVLIKVANTIRDMLRETDVFCRTGGEEFMLMMPETKFEDGLKIANRVREVVENIPLSEVPKTITISIGLVELTRWDTLQTFYKRADEALYQAKQNGRNRVETINVESHVSVSSD